MTLASRNLWIFGGSLALSGPEVDPKCWLASPPRAAGRLKSEVIIVQDKTTVNTSQPAEEEKISWHRLRLSVYIRISQL